MMILLGKNVFIAVDLDETFSQRHSPKERSAPEWGGSKRMFSYEVGLNCGLSCRARRIWKEMREFCTNDRLGLWGHPFLSLSLKSSCWAEIQPLWRECHLASMADWKTVPLWWGISLRLKSLGWNLHGNWICSPAGSLQSWAFTLQSECFLGPWLGLPFVHRDHRGLVSPCQGFLGVCNFSTET